MMPPVRSGSLAQGSTAAREACRPRAPQVCTASSPRAGASASTGVATGAQACLTGWSCRRHRQGPRASLHRRHHQGCTTSRSGERPNGSSWCVRLLSLPCSSASAASLISTVGRRDKCFQTPSSPSTRWLRRLLRWRHLGGSRPARHLDKDHSPRFRFRRCRRHACACRCVSTRRR